MVRRIGRTDLDAPVRVLLMCGCRLMVSVTSIFEVKGYGCVWNAEHGRQAWVSVDSPDAGYVAVCKQRGCGVRRNYEDRFTMAHTFAESHSRLHAHAVTLLAGDWVGKQIAPLLMGDEPPF